MTPEQIRAFGRRLIEIADNIESNSFANSPPEKDREIDANLAAALMGTTVQSAYRWARKYNIGWQLPSGQWRFSRNACKAFIRGNDDKVINFVEAFDLQKLSHSGDNKS